MQAVKSNTKSVPWIDWNEQIKAKRGEMAAITGLADAQERRARARQGLIHAIERANQSRYTPGGGITFAGQPAPQNPLELTSALRETDDGILKVAAALLIYLDGLAEKMDAGARQADPQKTLFVSETRAALREHRDALEDARHQEETLQAEKERVAGELAALEEKAPKASSSTLGAMAKERDQAAEERDRIAARLKELEADDGTLAVCRT
ncbi:hypothetical protein [Halomonas sp. H10-9-1]|uniref:hypothetical protein n=1 Tax=Halomonas sp. H10-9-1 TaxID=2950871 RepID=UPI0032DE2EFD